jgi:hypothetical protein
MSLEDKVDALTLAVDALTDSNQHLAATLRSLFAGPVKTMPPAAQAVVKAAVEPAADPVVTDLAGGAEPPKRGRPRKAPPADPMSQAGGSTQSKTSPDAASTSAATTSAATTSAATTSAATTSASADLAPTYDDLKALVTRVADEQGRSAAVALFAKLGVASGKVYAEEEHAAEIPAAVAAFRAALGE